MNVIIFSKDRAMQLDLLLRSMPDGWKPKIYFKASTQEYFDGYEKLFSLKRPMNVVMEAVSFKGDMFDMDIISKTDPLTMFLTDDDVFINPLPELDGIEIILRTNPEIVCVSLRLHPEMDYCYTLNRKQKRPKIAGYFAIDAQCWDWRTADADYGYPMSLDGHIFRTADILPLLKRLEYSNPNELEGQLARHPINRPYMMCFDKSIIVNDPVNRVQDTVPNRHGNVSAEYLNDLWLQGKRIRLEPFLGVKNNACHMELPIEFE